MESEKDPDNDSFTFCGNLIIQTSNHSGWNIVNETSLEGNGVETLPSELPQPTGTSIISHEIPNCSMAKAITNTYTLPNPPNVPKKAKEYFWSNEPIDKSKEVIGVVGDPHNICEKPRRKKYTADFSAILHNDPKNYKQAMCHEYSDNWKKEIP
ncbi:hypothetical protein O181_091000 [Austropuccinia psidii MF-1]|uniref:Uncharacterized protein n=1 Tax=Austropuccinia psidii MF-1 TaxID=1389203 RepID=A0A9Q3P7M9_9BASI|nr:hypothetical protein [Austropuccinia psidii MF-1]